MCITPTVLNNGTEVSCRYCWQCRKDRVNDLIGRCIAESKFSNQTYALTLTYDEEQGVKAVSLEYSDVQKFLKNLRYAGYKVRYLVTGEYGTKKNRAHWHIILFFRGEKHVNPETLEQVEYGDKPRDGEYRVKWHHWKHGYVYFQEPNWKGMKYVVKYVLKDEDERVKITHLAMSKKPPLGNEYFLELAKQHVNEMIAPKNSIYKFREVKNLRGKIIKFRMRGKTKDTFLRRIRWRWHKKYYPLVPQNDLFEEYFENEVKKLPWDLDYEIARLHKKYPDYKPNVEIEKTELIYQGIPGILLKTKNQYDLYTEVNGWQEVQKTIVDQLLKRSKLVSREKLTSA